MIFQIMDQELLTSGARVPRFMQITVLLQREIIGGQYLPGDRLPPESDLASQLKVAVGTLRKALSELELRGLVERRQGSGTYVKKADDAMPENQAAVYQFFRLERLDGGGFPGAEVLDVNRIGCVNTAKQLHIDPRSKHWRIRRIRTLDQTAVAAEEICIAAKHTRTLNSADLSASLYEHYRKHFNQWIVRVEDSVGCEPAPNWFVPTQKRDCGVVRRVAWNQLDEVTEVSTTWFDTSLCRYTARWS